MLLNRGVGVWADFVSQPSPRALTDAGVKAVGLYLKYFDAAYWAALEAAGIIVVPIFEVSETRALAGAPQGRTDGRVGAAKARSFGVPSGKHIIYTHDSNAFNDNVPLYFRAAFDEVAAAGYIPIGGYWSKQVADANARAGVPDTFNVAPAAWAWGGGRDSRAQVWQRPSAPLATDPRFRVDLGDCKIAVELWHPHDVAPKPPYIPTPIDIEGDTDMVKNAEDLSDADIAALVQRELLADGALSGHDDPNAKAGKVFWFIKDDGDLRHILTIGELVGRGGEAKAQPLTTVVLLTFGTV